MRVTYRERQLRHYILRFRVIRRVFDICDSVSIIKYLILINSKLDNIVSRKTSAGEANKFSLSFFEIT